MKKEKYNVAVAGATGAVGTEMVSILEERNFPVANLRLLASTRGAGTKMEFKGNEYTVEVLNENSFSGVEIGLFSPGGSEVKNLHPSQGRQAVSSSTTPVLFGWIRRFLWSFRK